MFSIYVLTSVRSGKRYIGSTGKDVLVRMKEHNSGASQFTRGHRPWQLVYTELFGNKSDALKREQFLKSGQGRRFLDTITKMRG